MKKRYIVSGIDKLILEDYLRSSEVIDRLAGSYALKIGEARVIYDSHERILRTEQRGLVEKIIKEHLDLPHMNLHVFTIGD